jgi:Na+-driven multidrug efflux pump
MMILYVPLAIVGRQLYGIAGIFGAYAIANILSGLLSYLWARRTAHNLLSVSHVHADSAGGHK